MIPLHDAKHSDVQEKVHSFFQSFVPFAGESGDTLISSYEKTTDIFYINDGIVKQSIVTQKGQELCLNLFKPGSFFPLIDTLADVTSEYAFSPLIRVSGWKAPENEVRQFITQNNDVLLDLNTRLLKGLHGLLKKTEKLMDGDASGLILQTLEVLGERFPDTSLPTTTIVIPLTHQQLANCTGLSRETVTRELSSLRVAGKILIEQHHITLL